MSEVRRSKDNFWRINSAGWHSICKAIPLETIQKDAAETEKKLRERGTSLGKGNKKGGGKKGKK